MSVILTGMNMPKNCFSCGLKIRGMCPRLLKNISIITDKTVDERCPLRPLNTILDEIRNEIIKAHLNIIEKTDFDTGRTYGYEEVLSIIDKYRKENE